MSKKNFKYYKYWYKVHKEINTHYEELYKVAMKEMRFNSLQRHHFKELLEEVDTLLEKWLKPSVVRAVIKNGMERADIDIGIHFDLECGGIDESGFNTNKK